MPVFASFYVHRVDVRVVHKLELIPINLVEMFSSAKY